MTVLLLGPGAAASAWWLAGRAVRPIDRVRRVAEDIEGTDLSRRIDLDQGPTEIVALAAAFDAMLERLHQAAETQRQLIEETRHELRTPLAVLITNAEVHPTIDAREQALLEHPHHLDRKLGVADRPRCRRTLAGNPERVQGDLAAVLGEHRADRLDPEA